MCLGKVSAGGEKDERKETDQYRYSGDAHDVGCVAAVSGLFFPGIEQHDDESKENRSEQRAVGHFAEDGAVEQAHWIQDPAVRAPLNGGGGTMGGFGVSS